MMHHAAGYQAEMTDSEDEGEGKDKTVENGRPKEEEADKTLERPKVREKPCR